MDVATWPEDFHSKPATVVLQMANYHLTTFSKLLQREIVMHAQLRHTNIIPLLGVFRESESDPPMMILPFMEKGSASDYLKTLATTNVKFLALTVIGIVRIFADPQSHLLPDLSIYRYTISLAR